MGPIQGEDMQAVGHNMPQLLVLWSQIPVELLYRVSQEHNIGNYFGPYNPSA